MQTKNRQKLALHYRTQTQNLIKTLVNTTVGKIYLTLLVNLHRLGGPPGREG